MTEEEKEAAEEKERIAERTQALLFDILREDQQNAKHKERTIDDFDCSYGYDKADSLYIMFSEMMEYLLSKGISNYRMGLIFGDMLHRKVIRSVGTGYCYKRFMMGFCENLMNESKYTEGVKNG